MRLNPRQGLPAFLLRHAHQVTEASARTSARGVAGQAGVQILVEVRLTLSVKPEDVHELLHNVEAEICPVEEAR
jgi:hypothetical protein